MQGSILSCIIFGLIDDELLRLYGGSEGGLTDDVLPSVDEDVVHCSGYADDTVLYVVGRDLPAMKQKLQNSIDAAVLWGEGAGLRFSAEKTTAVLFTRRRKVVLPDNILLDGNPLKYSTTVKYLGVLLSSSMNWRQSNFSAL